MDRVTQDILEATNGIDYGCDFVNGECEGRRKRLARGLKDIGNPCCTSSCHHNCGYLGIKAEDLPEEYLPYFSYPKGFLTETGCGLPKAMRSRRCIVYTCIDSNASPETRKFLIQLEEIR